jgi:hypothetical protein
MRKIRGKNVIFELFPLLGFTQRIWAASPNDAKIPKLHSFVHFFVPLSPSSFCYLHLLLPPSNFPFQSPLPISSSLSPSFTSSLFPFLSQRIKKFNHRRIVKNDTVPVPNCKKSPNFLPILSGKKNSLKQLKG